MRMLTFCTLFDHKYLDKGLALYKSLVNVCDDFELFVLAMSNRCYEILEDLNYPHLKPIALADFEDEELLRVKPTRKMGEYCWTCSSSLILYVLRRYKPEYCTYLDADLYFYSDPKVIIKEMISKNASVQIIGHRFDSKLAGREEQVGKYCVEFDTFKNDDKGLMLLTKWRNQCLEHCSLDGDGIYWGDQKYQDHWCEDYGFVIETENLGAGIAPWNVRQYSSRGKYLYNKQFKKTCSLVFYHFENIEYKTRYKVDINVSGLIRSDFFFVRKLYKAYLKEVDKNKDLLFRLYDLDILLQKHPGVDNSRAYSASLASYLKEVISRLVRTISF